MSERLASARGYRGSELALIAITVSRVEAATLASALGANGIATHIDGFWHASAQVNSLALGGHRIYVPSVDYASASDLVRELGLPDGWRFGFGARRAVVKLLAGIAGCMTAIIGLAIAVGGWSVAALAAVPLTVLSVPVSPQGRPDYFLAEPETE